MPNINSIDYNSHYTKKFIKVFESVHSCINIFCDLIPYITYVCVCMC